MGTTNSKISLTPNWNRIIKKKGMINMRKMKIKRSNIKRSIRLGILAVLGLLIILSAYSTIGAYQQPTTKTETYTEPAISYTHSGKYDFIAYLNYNTLYGSSGTALRPGEATIFKKLVNYINASFNYKFQADKTATVEGTYKLEATVQTDMWSKISVLIPAQSFEGDEDTSFTVDFPFNLKEYEDLVTKINEETGVIAQNPTLILKFTVLTTAETEFGQIREGFAPTIQVSLSGNVLEFQGDLLTKQPGSIETEKTEIVKLDTTQQRNTWTIATILSSTFFVIFALLTSSKTTEESPADILYKKIQKKYKDWIVEAETQPLTGLTKTISMKSFDDLIKISEELGKPVIHYKTTTANPGIMHTFYIFDDDIHYKYILPNEETITKTAKCPECGEKIKCEGALGKTVNVKCPTCDNKGKVTLTKTNGVFEKLFASKITSK